jgi:uncharacterized protein (DUF362 family)
MNNRVFKKKVNGSLNKAVKEAINAYGDINSLLREDEKVLLKPNFNTADEYSGSTDLEFLREITKQVLETKVSEVYIGDSSTFAMLKNTESVLKEKGIYELKKLDKRVKIVNFDEGEWIKKEILGGKYLKNASVPEILNRVDRLIFLPCLKTHFLAQYTGALKLSVGLMKPRERLSLHMKNLQEKVAELNLLFKPDLIVMDGRTCFIRKGPMDGPREYPDFILSSKSRVDIDIEGINIIKSYEKSDLYGIDAESITQIKRAIELSID